MRRGDGIVDIMGMMRARLAQADGKQRAADNGAGFAEVQPPAPRASLCARRSTECAALLSRNGNSPNLVPMVSTGIRKTATMAEVAMTAIRSPGQRGRTRFSPWIRPTAPSAIATAGVTDARALARDLMSRARSAALGVIGPDHGGPHVSRVALICTAEAGCLTLISDLALHARGVNADPRVSVLIGGTGGRGDPLPHPRLTLRALWLSHAPKAKLYIDFADFHFIRFRPLSGLLNAGFGKAYELDKKDLTLPPDRGDRSSN